MHYLSLFKILKVIILLNCLDIFITSVLHHKKTPNIRLSIHQQEITLNFQYKHTVKPKYLLTNQA